MQTYKDFTNLKERIERDNGKYSLKGGNNFPRDQIKVGGVVYELERYGVATGEVDNLLYNFIHFKGGKKEITIFYQSPTDNGILWERRPFEVVKIEYKNDQTK